MVTSLIVGFQLILTYGVHSFYTYFCYIVFVPELCYDGEAFTGTLSRQFEQKRLNCNLIV